MIIAHAIIGSAGLAAVLATAVALIGVAVVLTVSAVVRNTRRLGEQQAVPLWWDQSPVPEDKGMSAR